MRYEAFLVTLGLLALTCAGAGLCPPLPRTGCFQSTNVDATIRSNPFGDINAVDWIWTEDGIDYDLPLEFPAPSVSNPTGSYVLCYYDGNTVTQTETNAPVGNDENLEYFAAEFGTSLEVTAAFPKQIKVRTSGLARSWANSITVSQRTNAISQLLEVTSAKCWSRAVSFNNINPPPFKAGGYLDINTTPALLDTLAARYNARSNGQSLNMISFSAAFGPADLFQIGATTPLAGFNLKAHFSAYHVLGWYGGRWFLRDGFSSIPPGVSSPTIDSIDAIYFNASVIINSNNIATISQYLDANTLNPPPAPAIGIPSDTIGGFGYNVGYTLQVQDVGATYAILTGNNDFRAVPGALVCQGSHPRCFSKLLSLCPKPTGTSLVGCSFNPPRVPANIPLQSSLNTWRLANPTRASSLLTRQNNAEPIGRTLWIALSPRIAPSPAVFKTLHGVNNAFLETLQTTALLSFHYAIQPVVSSAALAAGTRAALSNGSGVGWLASYGFAVSGSSGPLPTFNLGKTPIAIV